MGYAARAGIVAIGLLFTGALLFATRHAPASRPSGHLRTRPRPVRAGTCARAMPSSSGPRKAFAVLPGISRGGSTIGAALLRGVDRETAARFSFLLSVPAIAGAAIPQATDDALADAGANVGPYLVGTVAAMVVGYLALTLLVAIVKRGGFHYFAYYCWALGMGIGVWSFLALARLGEGFNEPVAMRGQ